MKTKLALALDARGIPPSEAARLTGIPLYTVYKHYSGGRSIGLRSLGLYVQFLGIPLAELVPDLAEASDRATRQTCVDRGEAENGFVLP